MFLIPYSVIETWPPMNLVDPVRRSQVVLWLTPGIFLIIASICVSIRLWTRIWVRRWFGLDDLFIVLAFLCSIAVSTLVGIGTSKYSWDRHMWDMDLSVYTDSLKTLYFTRILWGQASSFVRFSVICLYYRLIRTCQAPRHFFWIMHATTAYNFIIWIYYIFSGILPCVPIHAYWTIPYMTEAFCVNDGKAMQAAGVLNTFAEFILAILPCLAVFQLRVKRRQRWQILGLLSLGWLVVIVGCCRTYFIWKALDTYDLTWYSGPQWICSEIENDLALICACVVPLRPLVGRTIRRLKLEDKELEAFGRASDEHTITGSQISQKTDAQDIVEWEATMRKFDLEGIAMDGLGYSVTITAPLTPGYSSKRTNWLSRIAAAKIFSGDVTRNVLTRKRTLTDRQLSRTTSNAATHLVIPQRMDVQVRESWRSDAGDKAVRWGSVAAPTEESNSVSDINSTLDQFQFHAEYVGDSTEAVLKPVVLVTRSSLDKEIGTESEILTENPTEMTTETTTATEPGLSVNYPPRSSYQSVPGKATEILGMNSLPEDGSGDESVYALPNMPSPPERSSPSGRKFWNRGSKM